MYTYISLYKLIYVRRLYATTYRIPILPNSKLKILYSTYIASLPLYSLSSLAILCVFFLGQKYIQL